MSRIAVRLGTDAAGPGLIQSQTFGRHIVGASCSASKCKPRFWVYRKDSSARYGLSVNGPVHQRTVRLRLLAVVLFCGHRKSFVPCATMT